VVKMKISELKPGQGNIDIIGVIKEVGEERTFNKYGRELRVSNAVIEDESGSIKLTLWNEDCGKFKEGDKVHIINGYVSEFQGEMQLTSGKFGKIELANGSASEGVAGSDAKEDIPDSDEEEKESSTQGPEEAPKVKSEEGDVEADYINGTR